MWLSALFLVKEENVHGDLNEGETVKVSAQRLQCARVMWRPLTPVCCLSGNRQGGLWPPQASHSAVFLSVAGGRQKNGFAVGCRN